MKAKSLALLLLAATPFFVGQSGCEDTRSQRMALNQESYTVDHSVERCLIPK